MAEIIGPLVCAPLILPPSFLAHLRFAVLPLVFHSIQDEIPDASKPLITRLYQLWLVLVATLIVNMIACIFILVSGASSGGSDLGSSIGQVSSPAPSHHHI